MKIKFKTGEEITMEYDSSSFDGDSTSILTLYKEDEDGEDQQVAMINLNEVLYTEE